MADVRGVTFEIADDLPPLTADAGRVELVLMNLFANAVKYSDPAKADARRAGGAASPASGRRLRVEDNGIGIPDGQACRSSSSSSCACIPISTTNSARRASAWGCRSCASAWRRWAAR